MTLLLLVPVLLFSIVVHEVAHAWQARREGDPTADELGRITLNPIPHLDFVGSFLVPALLWAGGANFLFGWAKPVPVVPDNYREPRKGDIRVSLAGIVSNLILAVLCTLLSAAVVAAGPALESLVGGGAVDVFQRAMFFGIFINLILALFNLLPIPPLDGSHVVYHFLPPELAERYRRFGRYGILAMIGVLFFVPGAFDFLLAPIYRLVGVADAFIRLWA